ncbi:MAG: hypothetical protein LVQ96_01960 [Thermoplasmatales archaeon]|nr:hypothetical protein [Thermoplasmatales archaeon]MCW6169916.1 hypothetical protein [Thermoplasmatales archaeon]
MKMIRDEATLLIMLIVVGMVLWVMNSINYLEIPMGGGTVFNLGYVLGLIFFAIAILMLVRIKKRKTTLTMGNS